MSGWMEQEEGSEVEKLKCQGEKDRGKSGGRDEGGRERGQKRQMTINPVGYHLNYAVV